MKVIDAISLSQKIQKGEKYTVIDIREDYEREISGIPSIAIPMGEIEEKAHELPTDKPLVVMCKTGQRAEAVVNFLERKFKMNNLWLLEGGLMSWIDSVDQNLEKY